MAAEKLYITFVVFDLNCSKCDRSMRDVNPKFQLDQHTNQMPMNFWQIEVSIYCPPPK